MEHVGNYGLFSVVGGLWNMRLAALESAIIELSYSIVPPSSDSPLSESEQKQNKELTSLICKYVQLGGSLEYLASLIPSKEVKAFVLLMQFTL